MPRLRLVLCLSLAVLFVVSSAAARDLNGLRSAHHRPLLHRDGAFAVLAQRHADDLARRNHLDHYGFLSARVPVGARAENVSYGCADEACAIRRWSRSARHRANMLRADLRGYGIGSAVSSSGRRYWVLVLGR